MNKFKKVMLIIGGVFALIGGIIIAILSLMNKKGEQEVAKVDSMVKENKEEIKSLEEEVKTSNETIIDNKEKIEELNKEKKIIETDLLIIDEEKKKIRKKKLTEKEIQDKINDVEKELFN